MTLKLVENVEKLEVYNFQDIAGCARRFADQHEQGKLGEPVRLIVVADLPDGVAISVWGDNASGYELMGILEAAKLRAHEVHVLDDE